MSGHTPGPWRLVEKGGAPRTVMALKDKTVCTYPYSFGKVDEANLRAIAAVPDLLRCLEVLLAHKPGATGARVDTARENARAALAKARGTP